MIENATLQFKKALLTGYAALDKFIPLGKYYLLICITGRPALDDQIQYFNLRRSQASMIGVFLVLIEDSFLQSSILIYLASLSYSGKRPRLQADIKAARNLDKNKLFSFNKFSISIFFFSKQGGDVQVLYISKQGHVPTPPSPT